MQPCSRWSSWRCDVSVAHRAQEESWTGEFAVCNVCRLSTKPFVPNVIRVCTSLRVFLWSSLPMFKCEFNYCRGKDREIIIYRDCFHCFSQFSVLKGSMKKMIHIQILISMLGEINLDRYILFDIILTIILNDA